MRTFNEFLENMRVDESIDKKDSIQNLISLSKFGKNEFSKWLDGLSREYGEFEEYPTSGEIFIAVAPDDNLSDDLSESINIFKPRVVKSNQGMLEENYYFKVDNILRKVNYNYLIARELISRIWFV